MLFVMLVQCNGKTPGLRIEVHYRLNIRIHRKKLDFLIASEFDIPQWQFVNRFPWTGTGTGGFN